MKNLIFLSLFLLSNLALYGQQISQRGVYSIDEEKPYRTYNNIIETHHGDSIYLYLHTWCFPEGSGCDYNQVIWAAINGVRYDTVLLSDLEVIPYFPGAYLQCSPTCEDKMFKLKLKVPEYLPVNKRMVWSISGVYVTNENSFQVMVLPAVVSGLVDFKAIEESVYIYNMQGNLVGVKQPGENLPPLQSGVYIYVSASGVSRGKYMVE
jgi:hypothetical protein